MEESQETKVGYEKTIYIYIYIYINRLTSVIEQNESTNDGQQHKPIAQGEPTYGLKKPLSPVR